MIIELHLLQNFAPSNLNRDDTGSPKDCEFGGYRRARISSQALKRAIRNDFSDSGILTESELGTRTRRVAVEIANRLSAKGRDRDAALSAVQRLLGAAKFKFKDNRTEYLLFLGHQDIDDFEALVDAHWDQLAGVVTGSGTTTQSRREAKQTAKSAIDALGTDLGKAIMGILARRRTADIALFGRMIADIPARNIEAASQVAHAISTHQVDTDFDFYSAVDDLRGLAEDAGAGMLGTIQFNSACFYRYSNVDCTALFANVDQDDDLTRRTVEAFIRGSINAIPTGKQNSMAAHNPPSLVVAVVRERGLCSLANAFVHPVNVRQDRERSLIEQSGERLIDYWGQLATMYGSAGIASWTVGLGPLSGRALSSNPNENHHAVTSVDELVRAVVEVGCVRPATVGGES